MVSQIASKFFITCCLVHVLVRWSNRSKMGKVWERRLVVRVGRRPWVGLKHLYGVSCFYIQADRFSWIHTFHLKPDLEQKKSTYKRIDSHGSMPSILKPGHGAEEERNLPRLGSGERVVSIALLPIGILT